MAIGGLKAMDSMAGWQGAAAKRVDSVSKNIQNEISTVERQKQGLSSKQELSAEEKAKKKQELQQELSSLNTKLRQRQEEINKEQKREALTGEVRAAGGDVSEAEKVKGKADTVNAEKIKADGSEAEKKNKDIKGAEKGNVSAEVQTAKKDAEDVKGAKDAENEKDEKLKDIGIPQKDAQSIVKGDSFREQMKRREAVIARMEGGIAILKGEIRQDELRGADTEKKKAELKKQEQKVRKAASGVPNVKGPSKSADAAVRIRAGEEKTKAGVKGKAEASVVKSSRDGVVIVTPNALENGIW